MHDGNRLSGETHIWDENTIRNSFVCMYMSMSRIKRVKYLFTKKNIFFLHELIKPLNNLDISKIFCGFSLFVWLIGWLVGCFIKVFLVCF